MKEKPTPKNPISRNVFRKKAKNLSGVKKLKTLRKRCIKRSEKI